MIDLAEIVRQNIGSDTEVIVSQSNDNRSYHKFEKNKEELGFENKYNISMR